MALCLPECAKLLGPAVPGTTTPHGARLRLPFLDKRNYYCDSSLKSKHCFGVRPQVVVPGTSFKLDPVDFAFNLGTATRWLEYNDAFLAADWRAPALTSRYTAPDSAQLVCGPCSSPWRVREAVLATALRPIHWWWQHKDHASGSESRAGCMGRTQAVRATPGSRGGDGGCRRFFTGFYGF